MTQSLRTLMSTFFCMLSLICSGVSAQNWAPYSVSPGASITYAATAGATNVQVTPGVGTVTVTITWTDGTVRTYTASPAAPLNVTRYNSEHQAYTVRSVKIAYNQPPGTHPADGRYKIQ